MNGTVTIAQAGPYSYTSPMNSTPMTATLIGYARCSTDRQDLAAQRHVLLDLGVAEGRIYTDHGLTGTTRARPGLDQALAAVRQGDTLIVPNLRRSRSRSHPHAHPRGHGHRLRQGEITWQAAQPLRPAAAGTLPHACHRRVFHQRSRRTLLHLKTNRLSHTQPASFSLAYDSAPYRNRPVVALSVIWLSGRLSWLIAVATAMLLLTAGTPSEYLRMSDDETQEAP